MLSINNQNNQSNIAEIDRQIINLISQRYKYMAVMQKQKPDLANSDKDFKAILESRKTGHYQQGYIRT